MVNTTSARVAQALRSVVAPPAKAEVLYGSTSSLNAQFWLGQFPWRPTAAWAALAGLLANEGLAQVSTLNWQMLALAFFLVDPLWGSIWRLAAGRSEVLSLHTQAAAYQLWMPYLRRQSPAQKLLGWDNTGVLPLLFRIALPAVVVTLALALVLGLPAIGLTVLVILATVLGWTSRRALQMPPVLLQSVVTIALPWVLIAQLVARGAFDATWVTPQTVLIGLCTLHHWGEGRLLRNHQDWLGVGLLAVAELGVVILLIVLQAPLWLALLIVLWLPAWLLIFQRQPLSRANFWWLLALLICALGLSNG
jgi:hypothetical protein